MKARWCILLSSLLSCAPALATTPGGELAGHNAPIEAPADSEFWELYDELADDNGHIPAPEEIPPPKEPLIPSREQQTRATPEDL